LAERPGGFTKGLHAFQSSPEGVAASTTTGTFSNRS
jgi:hypothetical protein